MNKTLVKLIGMHDQDMAQAVTWYKHTSEDAKKLLWLRIQRTCDAQNPFTSCMGRMAQIGMTQVAIEAEREGE